MTDSIQAITGTGDGSESSKGWIPGRKVKSFIWLVVAVIVTMSVAVKIGAPPDIAIQALWIVGLGGLFTIGGQSLVEATGRVSAGYAVAKSKMTKPKA